MINALRIQGVVIKEEIWNKRLLFAMLQSA